MKQLSFFVTTIILLFPVTTGSVPHMLNHHGYISDSQGEPVSGSANVTFDFYTSGSGGQSIWTQNFDLTFDGGYYSVVLGPGTPELLTTIFDGSELYLGTTLEGQLEFMPRMRIASVPYTFMAGSVEGEVKAVGGLVVDGVEVIDSRQQWLGNNISFGDLDDVPSDLADGDDVGLEGSGTGGTFAKFTESGMGDSVVVESDGKVGVGTGDPHSALHVDGGLQIGADTDDCAEGKEGTLRWHEFQVEVCDGNSWRPISQRPPETTVFAETGTTSWTAPGGVTSVWVLVVGGGGPGGRAGGGGGGGVIEVADYSVTPGDTYTVVVGAGGEGWSLDSDNGIKGGDSRFGDLVALAGGVGGYCGNPSTSKHNGGSGGGGGFCAEHPHSGGSGTTDQGHDGGDFTAGGRGGGGGGGGAGGVGATTNNSTGGNGGIGIESDIWPDNPNGTMYAGGGGGGCHSGTTATGGQGGGGNGDNDLSQVTPGVPNTGGGGGAYHGGSGHHANLNGGSGIVILYY